MSWLLANYMTVLMVAMTVIGCASTVAAAVAPLTKTKVDDKLAGAFSWLYKAMRKLGLNDMAPPKADPGPEEIRQ